MANKLNTAVEAAMYEKKLHDSSESKRVAEIGKRRKRRQLNSTEKKTEKYKPAQKPLPEPKSKVQAAWKFEGGPQKCYEELYDKLDRALVQLDGERDQLLVLQEVKQYIESKSCSKKAIGIIHEAVEPIASENSELNEEIEKLECIVKKAQIELDEYYEKSRLEPFPKNEVLQITVPSSDRNMATTARMQQERDHKLSDWSRQRIAQGWKRLSETRRPEVAKQLESFNKQPLSKDWLTIGYLLNYKISDLLLEKGDEEQKELIESCFKTIRENALLISQGFEFLQNVVAHKESLIVSYHSIGSLKHPETNTEEIVTCFKAFWNEYTSISKKAVSLNQEIDDSVAKLRELISEKLNFEQIDSRNLAILQKNRARADRIKKLEELFNDIKIAIQVQKKTLETLASQVEKRLKQDASSHLDSLFKYYIQKSGYFGYVCSENLFPYPPKETKEGLPLHKQTIEKALEKALESKKS